MRVAIICASYAAGKSYQENVWAEQLAKAGHAVCVFFAGKSDGPVQRVEQVIGSYEAQAAKTRRLPRSLFWSGRLPRLVREFKPDLIVVCGDKTFAVRLARDAKLANVPLVSTYSENLAMHEFDWRKRGISLRQRLWALAFLVSRGWPIRVLCRRSALVVGNTPQAREILLRVFKRREWRSIEAKMNDMPLGFSPDHFGFDADLRRRIRAELQISERDVLACVSSHFAPVKEPSIRLIVTGLARAMQTHATLKAVIVGFSDKPEHAAVSARIAGHIIATGALADRFIKLPFADRQRLNELYNGADLAIFNRASISCQEALGTGLIGCFANDGSLNHLVTQPDQGFFFRPGDEVDLAAKLSEAAAVLEQLDGPRRDAFRRELAEGSRWLGYDRIIAEILGRVTVSAR